MCEDKNNYKKKSINLITGRHSKVLTGGKKGI